MNDKMNQDTSGVTFDDVENRSESGSTASTDTQPLFESLEAGGFQDKQGFDTELGGTDTNWPMICGPS